MLALLGVAIEGWSFDARDFHMTLPGSLAMWVGFSMIATTFVSSYLASHLAGVQNRRDGLYHGVTIWGLNWSVISGLAISTLFFVISSLETAVAKTTTSLSEQVGAASALDQNVPNQTGAIRNLRTRIESALRATGKEQLQPKRIKQDVDAIRGQARRGQSTAHITDSILSKLQEKITALDRDAAINVMMSQLGMTRSQAERMVRSIAPIVGPFKKSMLNVKAELRDLANAVMKQGGIAAWWGFLFCLLTFIAALSGGMLGNVKVPSATTPGKSIYHMRRTGS